MTQPFRIVFACYPGMTHLDFTGPHQFLSRMPGAAVTIASPDGGTIPADGLSLADTVPIAEVKACDLICVPGGMKATQTALDQDFIGHIRRLALGAQYVTSVCTGSLILGAAGLLQGKRTACHWAWRDLLIPFGAIPDDGRVVKDGNRITGGGVTAGIDFALTVIAEVAGDDATRMIQLGLEYAPAPPFNSGRPETAPPEILEAYQARMAPLLAERRLEAEEAARRLKEETS